MLSWLLLRGRCRSCGEPIAWRYPLVELSTGAPAGAHRSSWSAPNQDVWLGLAFVLLLVPVTVIDLDFRIIPNKLMIAGTVAALAILALTRPDDIPEHLIAAAAAGGFLLVAAIAYPAGMGMGDVKLAFVMGLFLGRDVGVAMLVALLAGSLVGIAIMARKGVAARAARRRSRSAPSWRSAASSACSRASRSSTGTCARSPDRASPGAWGLDPSSATPGMPISGA